MDSAYYDTTLNSKLVLYKPCAPIIVLYYTTDLPDSTKSNSSPADGPPYYFRSCGSAPLLTNLFIALLYIHMLGLFTNNRHVETTSFVHIQRTRSLLRSRLEHDLTFHTCVYSFVVLSFILYADVSFIGFDFTVFLPCQHCNPIILRVQNIFETIILVISNG